MQQIPAQMIDILLGRRIIYPGDSLNIMLLAINPTNIEREYTFYLILQRSDVPVPSQEWTVVDQQTLLCPVHEGVHVYFLLDSKQIACAQGRTKLVTPGEFLVFATSVLPKPGLPLPLTDGCTEFFCIDNRDMYPHKNKYLD